MACLFYNIGHRTWTLLNLLLFFFGLSFIFALGGVGSAVVLIPILSWLGLPIIFSPIILAPVGAWVEHQVSTRVLFSSLPFFYVLTPPCNE